MDKTINNLNSFEGEKNTTIGRWFLFHSRKILYTFYTTTSTMMEITIKSFVDFNISLLKPENLSKHE